MEDLHVQRNGIGMKNAEGYMDPTAFEAISSADARKFAYRPVIYVCSPFSGDIEGNLELARKYSRFVVDEGGIPLTPHLYLPQFMQEETERELAMFMDLALLSKCAELWAFGDVISPGMQVEIDRAQHKGMPVRFVSKEEVLCTK
jgi:hypothetical protein